VGQYVGLALVAMPFSQAHGVATSASPTCDYSPVVIFDATLSLKPSHSEGMAFN
jgi:hypothetical protein